MTCVISPEMQSANPAFLIIFNDLIGSENSKKYEVVM